MTCSRPLALVLPISKGGNYSFNKALPIFLELESFIQLNGTPEGGLICRSIYIE